MSKLVLNGDTSGSVTLDAPAVSGTTILTLPTTTSTLAINGPAFSAYLAGSSQTVTSATWTKATLDTELFDTNNNFASSRFTPTVAGYYQINGAVRCTSSVNFSRYIVGIWKNGAEYLRSSETVFTSALATQIQAGSGCVVYLNGSTDYVELYGFITGTGTLTFANDGGQAFTSFMSGCLVRGA